VTNIGSIVFDIIANTSSVDKATRNTVRGFDKIEKEAKQTAAVVTTSSKTAAAGIKQISVQAIAAGAAISDIGRGLSMKLTLPIVAFGAASIKAFADFDSAMNQSLSIMDVTEAQAQQMRKTAIDMSKDSRFSAAQMAESYFFLASAGLSAEQQISALPIVTEFATAGMFDLATATDLATDAQSALGLSFKDPEKNARQLGRVTDVLVKANTTANASVLQFSEAITNSGGAAMRKYNILLEEGTAILAAYANQGMKGAEAGNMLSRMMTLLDKGARENADAFKEAGIAVFDSEGNFNSFADIIEQMTDHLGEMSAAERGAALDTLGFATLAQKAITPLLGQGEAIRELSAAMEDAYGTRMDVAMKQEESFSAGLARAKNNVVALAISIGSTLAPAMTAIADLVKNVADAFSNLTEGERQVVVGIAAIVAAAGPILLIFGKLMILLPFIKAGFVALGVGILPLAGIMAAAAAAGVALGIALAEILDELDGVQAAEQEMSFGEKIQEWITMFRVLVNEVKFGIKLFMELGQNLFAEYFTNIKRLWDLITGKMSIGEFLESQTTGMVDSFEQVWEANRAARDAGEAAIMESVVKGVAGEVGKAEMLGGAGAAKGAEKAVADAMAGLDDQIADDMLDLEADFNKQLMNLPMKAKREQKKSPVPLGISEPFAKAVEDGSLAAYKLEQGIVSPEQQVQKDQLNVQKEQLKQQKKQDNYMQDIRDSVASIDTSLMGIRVGGIA